MNKKLTDAVAVVSAQANKMGLKCLSHRLKAMLAIANANEKVKARKKKK
jgi:hypothetical protein